MIKYTIINHPQDAAAAGIYTYFINKKFKKSFKSVLNGKGTKLVRNQYKNVDYNALKNRKNEIKLVFQFTRKYV